MFRKGNLILEWVKKSRRKAGFFDAECGIVRRGTSPRLPPMGEQPLRFLTLKSEHRMVLTFFYKNSVLPIDFSVVMW